MVSNSTSKKQVFKPRVLYSTQFSKTQYTSLQLYFKRIVERTIFYALTLLISKIPWILRVKLLSPLDSHIDYKLFLFFSLLGLVQSFWELRHRATHRFGKKKKEMNGNKINAVFYAESYHPIQAGSIDGTDILPHDNAIYRAHLCASAGLCIYTPLSLSLSLSPLQFSLFQFYPSLFALFSDDPFGDPKVIGDPYCTVFVGRLSRHTSEDTLHEVSSLFNPCTLCLVAEKAQRKINK